ncbi:DEAD-box ATP-dependent RNA helicase DeaD (= CshA) [hydrothermal vent metagenome]|uniref:RNA helicase n=1 Tax=hydrothermal vent metagenome TaxID=652676 RepID=A0A3B0RMD7_9ZZZZ
MKKITTFQDLDLSKELLKAISTMGFEEPTPIQAKTIPVLLAGKDVIGQAQTGTGKTAAFGIPIVEIVEPKKRDVQAIILAPTRELAIQAAEEMNKLGRYKGLHALPVYGGTSILRQINALKRGVHIVVGTPGRVLDHLQRRTLNLKGVKIVVLDEADEMLDMGFVDDITKILKETPDNRQTMLFSATMAPGILKISKRYMTDPEKLKIATDTLTAPKINQIFLEVRQSGKLEALSRFIDSSDGGRFLIFCHTKREADDVSSDLQLRGYDAGAIHGDFSQQQREAILKRFKQGGIDMLVATDVAARGIDISDISHVINFSIPQNPESYVHRIGRTGRAGREGVAITFVTPREGKQINLIRRVAKADIKKGRLPSKAEVMGSRLTALTEKIQTFIDDKRFDTFLKLAENLSANTEPIEIAAALLKFQLEGFDTVNVAQDSSLDETGASAGMARLFITIGKEQGIRSGDIISEISKKAGIEANAIQGVKIFDTFTFVDVPRDGAEKVIELFHRKMISGKNVKVTPARPRSDRDDRPNRGAKSPRGKQQYGSKKQRR